MGNGNIRYTLLWYVILNQRRGKWNYTWIDFYFQHAIAWLLLLAALHGQLIIFYRAVDSI